MLKELIKQLAQEQKELKKARKTGPYEVIRDPDYGWPLPSKQPKYIREAWYAGSKVQSNKIRITAALNLYHEIRGSDYRHNVPIQSKWSYDHDYESLKLAMMPK